MTNFPTRQELETMSLASLRNAPIETKEQEDLVQEILNTRIGQMPPQQQVYRGDVPFEIKDKETELKWQKILDEREAAIRNIGKPEEQILVETVSALESQKTELEKELIQEPVLTQEKFCEFCEAKGPIKHKKDCTRPI